MMVLVSLAVSVGYVFSVATTFFFTGVGDFYWEISTLVVFLLFGHWMEMRMTSRATGALQELVKLIPPTANVQRDGGFIEVLTSEVRVGDVLLIRPGEKVPIDGVIIDGRSALDESMITGEPRPVSKEVGDEAIGGTIAMVISQRVADLFCRHPAFSGSGAASGIAQVVPRNVVFQHLASVLRIDEVIELSAVADTVRTGQTSAPAHIGAEVLSFQVFAHGFFLFLTLHSTE